jgi:hypothetical protein
MLAMCIHTCVASVDGAAAATSLINSMAPTIAYDPWIVLYLSAPTPLPCVSVLLTPFTCKHCECLPQVPRQVH